jgi:aminotransferase
MIVTEEVLLNHSLKFSKIAREKNSNNEFIYSLGLGEPIFDTPKPIVDATIKALHDGLTKYSNPAGLIELRTLIRNKLLKDNGIHTEIDNIVVTPGTKQGLQIALMALLKPGDEVINHTPSYISYIPQVKIAEPQATIVNVNLNKDDFSINIEALKVAITQKTKVIILNSPHNPTGKIISAKEIDQIACLIKGKPIYILSDEIYERLSYSEHSHISPASNLQLKEKVFTVNGFSKTYSMTGWRLGYLVAPSVFLEEIIAIQKHMNAHTATFIQKGACEAFSMPLDYYDRYNSDLRDKRQILLTIFQKNKIDIIAPEGGLFAFIKISNSGLSSDEFAAKLIEEKNVAVIPGIVYSPKWDSHIRISLVTNKDEFAEAIKRLASFIKEMTKND